MPYTGLIVMGGYVDEAGIGGMGGLWRSLGDDGDEKKMLLTLPETDIAPENGWLEYSFPFGIAHFDGTC